MKHDVRIPVHDCMLRGELRMASHPAGIVVFVHGSGTTRQDSLNRLVAARLGREGFAALLVDLLEDCQSHERHNVFDVETQAQRLIALKGWLRSQPGTRSLPIGYFGTGVGTGVALAAAAKAPQGVGALVARGGRPDTALRWLAQVRAPTLFIAAESGADRDWVHAAHRAAAAHKELVCIAGAGDSFREPGAVEAVARHACRWFARYLGTAGAPVDAPLEPRIRELETGLRERHPGSDCRVTVEDRPPRAYERRRFNVRLDISFAGRSFVVNREHDDDPGGALREAFNAAGGQLDDLEAASHRV